MPRSTVAAVGKQIEAGRPDAVYLIAGDDETEKSALVAAFSALVDEDLRGFNIQRFHAVDMNTGDKLAEGVASIAAAVRTVPMLSPHRVVFVMQAEHLIAPKRESEAATEALGRFEDLVTRPEPQTVLVLIAGNVDKRTRIYKVLAGAATVVECGVLQSPADAERWIRTRVAAAGREIDPSAARLLVERAGPALNRLRNEVDQLLLYAEGQRITAGDAREVAGPAALQDQWAMANAIESGDAAAALRQLSLMFDAGGVPEMILGQLGWLVRTKFPAIAPRSVRSAIDAVFRTDLDLKRSAGAPRILLERLVVELCAGRHQRAAGSTVRREPRRQS